VAKVRAVKLQPRRQRVEAGEPCDSLLMAQQEDERGRAAPVVCGYPGSFDAQLIEHR
jgi:hypothetical protein